MKTSKKSPVPTAVELSNRERYWPVPAKYLAGLEEFLAQGGTEKDLLRLGFIKDNEGRYYRDILSGAQDTSDPTEFSPLNPKDSARFKEYLFVPGKLGLLGRMGDTYLGRDGKFYIYNYPRA